MGGGVCGCFQHRWRSLTSHLSLFWSQQQGQWDPQSFFPPLSNPSWRPRLKTPVLLPERTDRLRPEASKAAATQQLVPPHCCAFLQHLQRSPTLRSINLQVSCFVSVLLSILPGCPDFPTQPGSGGWGPPLLASPEILHRRTLDSTAACAAGKGDVAVVTNAKPGRARKAVSSFSVWETEAGRAYFPTGGLSWLCFSAHLS